MPASAARRLFEHWDVLAGSDARASCASLGAAIAKADGFPGGQVADWSPSTPAIFLPVSSMCHDSFRRAFEAAVLMQRTREAELVIDLFPAPLIGSGRIGFAAPRNVDVDRVNAWPRVDRQWRAADRS
jgi:hypothetical protein